MIFVVSKIRVVEVVFPLVFSRYLPSGVVFFGSFMQSYRWSVGLPPSWQLVREPCGIYLETNSKFTPEKFWLEYLLTRILWVWLFLSEKKRQKTTLPETNGEFTPETLGLEGEISFWRPIFKGKLLVPGIVSIYLFRLRLELVNMLIPGTIDNVQWICEWCGPYKMAVMSNQLSWCVDFMLRNSCP